MKMNNYIYKIPVGTKLDRGVIIPVFLPFAGCPFQCIYCLQDKQTGAGQVSVADALQRLGRDVNTFVEKNSILPRSIEKIEIAFYGGTFTALQESELLLCLDVFKKIKGDLTALNIQVFGRCSTRPDCLGFDDFNCEDFFKADQVGNKEQKVLKVTKISEKNNFSHHANLLSLKNAGIDLIELGIQSFDTKALIRIGRGYSSSVAKAACQYVKDQGFELGIQLMPGIPNQSVETFHDDVNIAFEFKPACMRYYPCLVPEGTGLAKLWRSNEFTPWDLTTCVDALAYALHRAWQEEVPVIRLSVAPERGFDTQILAGVRHPALGSLIQAQALLYSFKEAKMRIELEEVDTYVEVKEVERLTKVEKKKISQDLDEAMGNGILDEENECNSYQLEFHVPKNFQGFIFGEKNTLKEIWANLLGLDNIIFDTEDFESINNSDSIILNLSDFEKRINVENFTTKFAILVKKLI